jgi:glycerol uptake facilitator-like aquaporin
MDRLNICLYEFIGTAMLVLGYNFTNAGLAVCFNLFVGILLAQKISGGMFNPAVTVAIYLTEGTLFNDSQLILMIICFQILGAYFGIIMGHLSMGEPAFLCPYEGRAGCLRYDDDEWVKVFLLELWCTFFFTLCILC